MLKIETQHMPEEAKVTLARWAPLVVSILVNGLLVGFWFGSAEGRLDAVEAHAGDLDVHMPLDEKLEIFVSRAEYLPQTKNIDDTLARIELKLDRAIEREIKQ